MFIHDWKKEVFTIPNFLSIFRIMLIPVYVFIYLNASQICDYYLAGSILTVSCLTDLIDGKIARQFHMVSTLGKILDPVADKLTQFALTLCLSTKYPVLRYVLVLFVIKEVFQATAGMIHLRNGSILPGALYAGKICTAILFLSLIILVLIPDLSNEIVVYIAILDTIFLLFSFMSYIRAYWGPANKMQKFEN